MKIPAIALSVFLAGFAHASSDTIFKNGFDPVPPVGCPATITYNGVDRTLLRFSAIQYGVNPGFRPGVNVEYWDNLWGHANRTDAVTPWPGVAGSFPVIIEFTPTAYVGAQFHTPAAPDLGLSGQFRNSTPSIGGTRTIMAISRACGDFDTYLPNPACRVDHAFGDPIDSGVPPDSSQLVAWGFRLPTGCLLPTDEDLYVNIIQADPSERTPACRGRFCLQAPASSFGTRPRSHRQAAPPDIRRVLRRRAFVTSRLGADSHER